MNRVALSSLIGRSPEFMETVRLIGRMAETEAPILIEGETGTGKEVTARAIHYGGARQDGPFVPVNCGAIPESLVENELFGHIRGAYTDAREPQPGLVALANGGSLFLDEVDALSPKAQVILLRFLQDLTYRPLGSRREERADVRIIAASNTPLSQAVQRKQFRIDLYYRLQILCLRLPPLRERVGDPELLANHFVRALSIRYRTREKTLDPAALPVLNAHLWPGNIRELENLIHREFLLAQHDHIRIPSERIAAERIAVGRHAGRLGNWPRGIGFNEAKALIIERFEREFVAHALAESRGNVSRAARLCGKERRAFGKLLRRHGIDRMQFDAEIDVANGDLPADPPQDGPADSPSGGAPVLSTVQA
jgi:DNA-binding NtrC family response regulator